MTVAPAAYARARPDAVAPGAPLADHGDMTSRADAPDATHACGRCGRDADLDIADLWLCVDCYHVAGSTCAGIGRIDRPAPPAVC